MDLKLRAIAAITIDTDIIKKTARPSAAIKEATGTHHDMLMTLSKADRSKQPPPHLVAWNSLVAFFGKEISCPETAQATKDYSIRMEARGGEPKDLIVILEHEIRHCALVKCYMKDHWKLEISTYPGTETERIWRTVRSTLQNKFGSVGEPGKAPPGDMARRIQSLIEQMTQEGTTSWGTAPAAEE